MPPAPDPRADNTSSVVIDAAALTVSGVRATVPIMVPIRSVQRLEDTARPRSVTWPRVHENASMQGNGVQTN